MNKHIKYFFIFIFFIINNNTENNNNGVKWFLGITGALGLSALAWGAKNSYQFKKSIREIPVDGDENTKKLINNLKSNLRNEVPFFLFQRKSFQFTGIRHEKNNAIEYLADFVLGIDDRAATIENKILVFNDKQKNERCDFIDKEIKIDNLTLPEYLPQELIDKLSSIKKSIQTEEKFLNFILGRVKNSQQNIIVKKDWQSYFIKFSIVFAITLITRFAKQNNQKSNFYRI